MGILNLSGEAVPIVNARGRVTSIHSEGVAEAHCSVLLVDKVSITGFGDIPIFEVQTEGIDGLPRDPLPDMFYIVTREVAEAMRGRPDVLIPDEPVTNEKGAVVGYRSFTRL